MVTIGVVNTFPIETHTSSEPIGGKEDLKTSAKHKPLFIVLVLLGSVGLLLAAGGVVGLGARQTWWTLDFLPSISTASALFLVAFGAVEGGLSLTIGVIGLLPMEEKRTEEKKGELLESSVSQTSNSSSPLSSTPPPSVKPIKTRVHLDKSLDALNVIQSKTVHDPNITNATQAIDTSYHRVDDSGINDLVYVHAQLGFGCVIDGTGHGNPKMQDALSLHFGDFISRYTQGLNSSWPDTVEKFSDYFIQQMQDLDSQFNNADLEQNQMKVYPDNIAEEKKKMFDREVELGSLLDPTYRPAMSFAQLVVVKDQVLLLTAQAGDTMIFVEMADGELISAQPAISQGVGQTIKIACREITGAKRVIGLSDGITEFLSFEELRTIINDTPDSTQLFGNLKECVLEGRAIDQTHKPIAANGSFLKSFIPNEMTCSDDLGFFALDL